MPSGDCSTSVWKASTAREDPNGRVSCATALENKSRAMEVVASRSERVGAMVAEMVSAMAAQVLLVYHKFLGECIQSASVSPMSTDKSFSMQVDQVRLLRPPSLMKSPQGE